MKDTEITRAVYGDSHAFKEGVEVGRKETIDKAIKWLFGNVYDYFNSEQQERVESFRKYMED